jgi:hypothetical protein
MSMARLETRFHFLNERRLPAILVADIGATGALRQLLDDLDERREEIDAALHRYGAILFRGFEITGPADLASVGSSGLSHSSAIDRD